MSKFFYVKLAANNIKNNSKTYIPYILSSIAMIMMFYNMSFITKAKDIGSMSDSMTLRSILSMGAVVVGLFSFMFLLYTNSFLVKRRKKEFGLFNILGMEKKHVARIMFFETVIIGIICITIGVLAGILLSKLMLLLLFKIISFNATFGFEIPVSAVIMTITLFGAVFFITLIYNVLQVHLAKPIELLKSGNVGEKEPKTKWFSASIGAICLGIGYYIALSTESPLAALALFFIAVVMVILGTHYLFTAGSVVILKLLRRNKKYYYKINHFTSVSGMIYRMKRNAAGLANICILSTMVIVMLSTTISLNVGMEDVLRTRYPRNILISAKSISDSQVKTIENIIKEQTALNKTEQINILRYRSKEFVTFQNGDSFTANREKSYTANNAAVVQLITLDDFNSMVNKSIVMSKGEALLYTMRGKIKGNTIDLNGVKLSVKERITDLNIDGIMTAMMVNSYFIVVNDIDIIKQVYEALEGNEKDMGNLSYYYGFDLNENKDTQIELTKALYKNIIDISDGIYVEGAESSRESLYSMYGGLLFLGIFLGLLFIMETVLIIYYKQITEGYDDKDRFEIMQKVGMSRHEVKKAVQSQVLTVFFLPLVMAITHLAFAFKVITKLLSTLNFTDVPLFTGCTIITVIVFAVFYTLVYAMTARTYYKIVR